MNVLFVYVIGTAVALGLIEVLAVKWAEWQKPLDDDSDDSSDDEFVSYVCQFCDWFRVSEPDHICRACVIDRYGIDPDPTGEHWERYNPGQKP